MIPPQDRPRVPFFRTELLVKHPCLICGKPVPDYVPEYCCSGHECACEGQPLEPCVCSEACMDAIMRHIGTSFDERRQRAGIPLWVNPNESVSLPRPADLP